MMLSGATAGWQILLGTAIVYCGTLAFYRLFLHPLARFPGPRLAAISRWYEGYYDVVQGGQYTRRIAELHQTYGPIIRISPYELHVNDPSFFEKLYRNDGRWDKYSWTYDAFGFPNATVCRAGHDVHKISRRAIAPFFSKQKVAAREELLRRNTEKLCRRIAAVNTVDIGAAISAYTRDNGNEYIFNKAHNELDRDDFGIELSVAATGSGSIWRTTKHLPWYGSLLRAIPMSLMSRIGDKYLLSFLRHAQVCEDSTREILNATSTSLPRNHNPSNMIEAILSSDRQPADKTLSHVLDEVITVDGAASETSSSVLRLVLYHVYTNANILQRLRGEISEAARQSAEPLTWKQLEQLPHLTATISEGLRLSPGIGTRAARITDHDLFYKNWCIPTGTPVGMTTMLMHTDESVYSDPLSFKPDRWMDPAARAALAPKFAPFLRGTRSCLGMYLAWAELYLSMAALVQRFDFSILDATAEDFQMRSDDFAIGVKAGCHLMVSVKPYKP